MDTKFTGVQHEHGLVVYDANEEKGLARMHGMLDHIDHLLTTVYGTLNGGSVAMLIKGMPPDIRGVSFCPACIAATILQVRELGDALEDLSKLPNIPMQDYLRK